MTELPDAIVCDGCDAVYRRPSLGHREVARCPRCDTELERHPGAMQRRLLPLVLACLVLFAIANTFPIVEIELHGLRSRTTLLGAVVALGEGERALVALLVLATTVLAPLLQLLMLAWLLVPWTLQRQAPGFAALVRVLQSLRPWGMVEVFLLGVLVAVVKLSSMAQVLPGPALWAFGALTVLLTAVLAFDPRGLWDMADAGGVVPAQGRSAAR